MTANRTEQERTTQPSLLPLKVEQLRQMPAVGEADLLRSLQLLPGIQSASDISSGLYIRGGGPDQTRIMLDKMPLYNPSHAFGFFSTFNPDAIKDVQLYKGAYPANYGGNLGAVLDVGHREGNRQKFYAHGGVSLVAARLMLEGPVGTGSWMVSSRRTYLDPLLAAVRSQGVAVPDYYFYDLNGRISQRWGDADTFVFSTYMGQDDLDFDIDANSEFGIRWGNRAFSARWTRIFTPTLFGSLLAGGSAYESKIGARIFDTPATFENNVRDLSVKIDLNYFASNFHNLSTGFILKDYTFDFSELFNQLEQLDLRQRSLLMALYIQDEWQLHQRTHLRLGARASYFDEGDRLDLLPRIALSHSLRTGLRLKLGGGSYRQYLQLITTEGFSGSDFWVPLDKTVKPGRSHQGVLGVEWEPSRRYFFSIEAYYTDLDNLVVLDNNVAVDQASRRSEDLFKAGGTGYSTGIEFFVQRRRGRLTGWAGYALGWTKRRFAELNEGRSFSPKYDRRHDLSFVTSYRFSSWVLGVNFVAATGQAFTPAAARYTLRSPSTGVIDDYVLPADRNSARLLPYHRLDMSVKRQLELWGSESEVYLQVFNLYSRRNEWFVQYGAENPDTKPEIIKMLPIIPTLGLNFKF